MERLLKLIELEPKFVTRKDDNHYQPHDDISKADGIWFLCPKCFRELGGSIGCHMVMCWCPSVPQTTLPTPGRWNLQGTGYLNLTLVAGSSSVLLISGCKAHFLVKNGEIIDC